MLQTMSSTASGVCVCVCVCVCMCVCVYVCMTPKSFKSCPNCEVQQLCPTAMQPNREF